MVDDVIFIFKILFNYNIEEVVFFCFGYVFVVDVEVDFVNLCCFSIIVIEKYILVEDMYSSIGIYFKYVFDFDGLMDNYIYVQFRINGEVLVVEELLK